MSRLKLLCQLPHLRTRRLTPASRVPTAARRTRIRISRESIRSDSVTPRGLGKCKRLSEIRKAFSIGRTTGFKPATSLFPGLLPAGVNLPVVYNVLAFKHVVVGMLGRCQT